MATGTTPLLGLALPVEGELDGIWGTTVNNSITSLLDSAVAGLASVSVTSANQALTFVALSANESRNAILKLTTTTTASFAAYVPPTSKIYVVWNASNYSATIFCSTVAGNTTAAGAGAVIPPGAKAVIFSDGTDCFGTGGAQAATSITTAASINPTINSPQYNVTALDSSATIFGPPAGLNGQKLVLRILDNGTSRSLTWTTSSGAYRVIGTALPTATVANKVLYVGCIYNAQANFWDVVSVIVQS
jgi:hypothetical protein